MGDFFSALQVFLVNDQGNGPHGGDDVSLFHHRMGVPGGTTDIRDQIDSGERIQVNL